MTGDAEGAQGYTEADAWRDNYDGMFARWLECDTERLALKEALRDADLHIRILTTDRDEAARDAGAKALEDAATALVRSMPYNWTLRPDGSEDPLSAAYEDGQRDAHELLVARAAALRAAPPTEAPREGNA